MLDCIEFFRKYFCKLFRKIDFQALMRLSSDFILKVNILLHYFSLKERFTIISRCFDPRQHHFEQHTQYDVAWDRRGRGDDWDILAKREVKDMYYRCSFIDCPPISTSINIRSRLQTRKSLVEVPHCVVVLNGMAFETILSRGNGLLIGTFTMRFIYIFSEIDMVIICINCLYYILESKCL